jgi:hypothetical protein
MRYSQPVFSAAVDVFDCGYDLRINDCPLQESWGNPVSCIQVVNEWLRNGRNVLTAQLLPLPGEDRLRPGAQLNLELTVREDSGEQREVVGRLVFQAGQASFRQGRAAGWLEPRLASRRDGPRLCLSLPLQLDVPFPRWAWEDAPAIPASVETIRGLFAELTALHGLFAAGDVEAVIARSRERNSERAISNYSDLAEQEEGQRDSYLSLRNNPAFGLQPLLPENVQLRLHGDGHLARLVSDFGESPLYYADKDAACLGELLFLFRRSRGGGWVVCR